MKIIRTLIQDFSYALIPPTTVFFLFLLRVFLLPDLYQLDVLAHFSGGLSIAWMTMILWQRWSERRWIVVNAAWLRDYTVWGTVGLVGVFWEFFEFSVDAFTGWTMQPSLADTMNDLFMDLLGGFLFLIVYRFAKKRRK